MKGYRVFTQGMYGNEDDKIYTTNYQIAVKDFNRQLKNAIKENDVIMDKEMFGEIKTDFKSPKWLGFEDIEPVESTNEPIEIICMKAPYIIHKQGKRLTASVFYDYRSSYEYDEHDTGVETVIIEEIEILN